MKPKLLSEGGQALILIALAAIALFGIAGLAIDGSAKYSDRRHAQNAADTAALSAALTLARDPTATLGGVPLWRYKAIQRADENGYDNNLVTNLVEVHNPPVSGIYSNCADVHFTCTDYVQVIITSHRQTWFMRVLGITETTNVVQAVASKISQNNSFNFGGNAVVALAPDECALMSQGGTNLSVVGGGMYSNSDDSTCSFKKESCKGVTDIDTDPITKNPGTITSVGGMSINTGCPPSANLAPGGSKQLPFPPPFEELAPPAECKKKATFPNDKVVTLSPGYYDSMPPKDNMTSVTLKPGVYCIGSTMKIKAGVDFGVEPGTFGVTPGVLLYFMPGGEFDIQGGSRVQLWGINQKNIDLDANVKPYKGLLIYAAPNYASGAPVGCFINGGSASDFQGTIFAPYCDITMNGGSDDTGFYTQLIGYNIKFSGNSFIHLNYDASSSPVWKIPLQVGLTK